MEVQLEGGNKVIIFLIYSLKLYSIIFSKKHPGTPYT